MSGVILNPMEANAMVNRMKCNNQEHVIGELTEDNSSVECTKHEIIDDNSLDVNSENDVQCSIGRNRSLTANSNGSNNISIVTIDEDDSSVVDSDSDIEDGTNYNRIEHRPSANGIVLMDKTVDTPNLCQSSILCANNDVKPNIGSIAVQNSTDITFGNKTFYQGPVTIKQFVYDKNRWKATDTHVNDNLGYINSSTDKISRIHQDYPDSVSHPDLLEKKWKCTNKQALFGAALAGILVCSLLALIIVVKYTSAIYDRNSSYDQIGDGDDSRLNIPIKSTIASDIITDTAGPLRIISRSEWIAQPPEHELTPLELPSTRVIIAHTATENCTTQAACTYQVRLIQTFHIESRGWDDIGYNFLVGGDGAVYVGRGWNTEGAHTKGYNKKSICIAFIGTFNKYLPPKRSLYAAQKMIEEGVKLKKLTSDYALYGHRQLLASESPGLTLYEVIKKWDHWTSEIK